MKANIISLKQSPRRGEAVERATEAGFDTFFFDAIDASTNPIVKTIAPRSGDSFRAQYGRDQTLGELANLLSHQALYKQLLKDDITGYHLILEDDFIPLVNASVLDNVVKVAENAGADVVILGYSKVDDELEHALDISNPLMKAIPIPSSHLEIGQRCHESSCGVVSYFVNSRFLELMVADEDYGHLTDDWTYHEKLRLKIFHVRPLCFREDFKRMSSALEADRSSSKGEAPIRLPAPLRPLWRHCLGVFRKAQFYARAK
jgi:GR25 family glycosyltransferase involved in LPS biosynthesis